MRAALLHRAEAPSDGVATDETQPQVQEDVVLLRLRPPVGPLRAADVVGQRDRRRVCSRCSASSAKRIGEQSSTNFDVVGWVEDLSLAIADPRRGAGSCSRSCSSVRSSQCSAT